MSQEAIVKPRRLRGFAARKVIYVPMDMPGQPFAKILRKRALREKKIGFCSLFSVGDKTVLYQATSAPLAALALEMLRVSGAEEIVHLGFCGSLTSSLVIGDVVAVAKALSDEGTSQHYFPEEKTFYPSGALLSEVENRLHRAGYLCQRATIVSTDAPFRETPAWLEEKQAQGAEIVDMETSAVFALSRFHGLKAASVQIVSDELSSGAWKIGFRRLSLRNRAKKCFLALL